MALNTTFLANQVNPQVMADMISAKIPQMIVVSPFATIDTTLTGRAGNTITIPSFKFIGEAEDVAEGVAAGTTTLETATEEFTIKKAVKSVQLTDEAVLSGLGNPVGQTNTQLAMAIATKVDADAMESLQGAQVKYSHDGILSYEGVVLANDLFNEEVQSDKVMFINPAQLTQLRLDPMFISADKYPKEVVMRGEVGMISGTRIIPSRRVKLVEGKYSCPIVKLTNEPTSEDDMPALTIFLKRDTMVETTRLDLEGITRITTNKHYGTAITNQEKVVLASFSAVGE